MGNVGDNTVSSYRLHASETQQLADPSVRTVELLGDSRQPITGRLATHPSNTTVKRYISLHYITLHYITSVGGVAVVERRSLTGELSLSCVRPAADG